MPLSHFQASLRWACALLVMAQHGAALAQVEPACNSRASQTLRLPAQSDFSQAHAFWLDKHQLLWPHMHATGRFALYMSKTGQLRNSELGITGADQRVPLKVVTFSAPALAPRFAWLKPGAQLKLDAHEAHLGVQVAKNTRFKLWAPSAQNVRLCVYPDPLSPATAVHSLSFTARTGVWQTQIRNLPRQHYYRYLVDVFVPGVGLVKNRVTDPYSIGLSANAARSLIADLNHPALKPPGWDHHPRPERALGPTELAIYELHVRDFSQSDASVPEALRGKYLAFTLPDTQGMRHLRALAQAGMTDIHLLPVFDFSSVPETACGTPKIEDEPNGMRQPQAVRAQARQDCYNWGYDPVHYSAPEGSYASDAQDGTARIRELRAAIAALHAAGLRVGMDVVYNHTAYFGQHAQSILDRIVPGYYHRRNLEGAVEQSTCQQCGNTATENRMMAKLVRDSLQHWVKAYQIDSFRFDLMGHQPLALMQQIRRDLPDTVHLLGEGWNFGEVANHARFIQASQHGLAGSGIASFSDRGRDAARGGGHGDDIHGIVHNKGFLNGLADQAASPENLHLLDLVRTGLAGTVAAYRMQTSTGDIRALKDLAYHELAAGYTSQAGEVVNYVENHDNLTLYDLHALRLPIDTSSHERARAQVLGLALTAFSQGIAYFHAGVDILRSKAMDNNSYDSGDHFNRLDWSYQDNHFASGLPPEADNAAFYPLLKPLLDYPGLRPQPEDIAFTRDAFRDLLRIRASTRLFHLNHAAEIQQRLHFLNTGPQQNPALVAAHLDGRDLPGDQFAALLYVVNASTQTQELTLPDWADAAYQLHPIHLAAEAADTRIASLARYSVGKLSIPARSAAVFVSK